jgi:hypothetical protein
MLALDQVAQMLAANPARLAQELAPLARDPEPALRLQLAELLGRTVHAAPANLLRQLSGDDNFEVAIEARLSLLTQEDASQWPPLRQALDDHRMTGKTAERIIRSLYRLPDRGTAALIELVKHEKPLYRITALRTYGAFNRHALDLALLWGCLEDSFAPVRQEAATLILAYPSRNRAADFPADRLASLVDSPFVDVRGLAVTLAALADQDTSRMLLMDLVLDEHTGIRANAIEFLIAKRLGDWQEVAKVSAADENREIRERTVKALLAVPIGPSLQVLEAIKATTQDRELYKLIVDALARPAP